MNLSQACQKAIAAVLEMELEFQHVLRESGPTEGAGPYILIIGPLDGEVKESESRLTKEKVVEIMNRARLVQPRPGMPDPGIIHPIPRPGREADSRLEEDLAELRKYQIARE